MVQVIGLLVAQGDPSVSECLQGWTGQGTLDSRPGVAPLSQALLVLGTQQSG